MKDTKDIENIFEGYHNGVDIEEKAKEIRATISALRDAEYIYSILNIAQKTKQMFQNLITTDSEKTYTLSIFVDSEGTEEPYISGHVEIDDEYADKESEVLQQTLMSNISHEDINTYGLKNISVSFEINQENINNIEEEILSAFSYNEAHVKLFKSTKLESKLDKNNKPNKNKTRI